MNYLNKIKALQYRAGVEADGIATAKTWIAIYSLVFTSYANQNSVEAIIKAIQENFGIRANGKAGFKTWDALYNLLIADEKLCRPPLAVNEHNENVIAHMPNEMVPFAKELIQLAANRGIQIQIMEDLSTTTEQQKLDAKENEMMKQIFTDAQTNFSTHNFGLTFNVGILENDEQVPKDHSALFAEVARLGESIGLTWSKAKKSATYIPQFELRPAWAVRMKESEMVEELYRRKKENLNLLAIL